MKFSGAGGPWLTLYSANLPRQFAATKHHFLDHWNEWMNDAPEAPAIRYFDQVLTVADIDLRSQGLAGWLSDSGIKAGDRVAVILQNVPEFTVAVLAAWKLGAVPVPCNPMYRPAELADLFIDFRPVAIVCDVRQVEEINAAVTSAGLNPAVITTDVRNGARVDQRVAPAGIASGSIGENWRASAAGKIIRPPRHGGELALILYTSGTTGRPKGVMIQHDALCFNAELSAIWMRLHSDSRMLGLAPYFHITGFVLHMAVSIVARCAVGLTYRFHPEVILAFQRDFEATTTVAAITAFNALSSLPDISIADFGHMDVAFSGGAPIAPALRNTLQQRLGLNLIPVYGMTETCAPTHMGLPGCEVPTDPETGALSVGVPISSTEMKIVDAKGNPLPPGQAGEVWVRGPQVTAGYWKRPLETAEVMAPEGWLRTGDVGTMDAAGWLYIVDRQKDMINAAGFKVWPRQVEDVLLEHSAVHEAAVVGEPDAYRGETVVAYVAVRAGAIVQAADLEAHCREKLAAYKVPRRFTILDEIPKTVTGKIRRVAVRTTPAAPSE